MTGGLANARKGSSNLVQETKASLGTLDTPEVNVQHWHRDVESSSRSAGRSLGVSAGIGGHDFKPSFLYGVEGRRRGGQTWNCRVRSSGNNDRAGHRRDFG